MRRLFNIILTAFVTTATLPATAASYKYVTTIATTTPAGSAGANLADGQPKSVKFSPCSSATALDQITFSLKYDAGKLSAEKRDVYFMFYRPDAFGTVFEPKYFVVVKRFPGASFQITSRPTVSDLNANKAEDIYVSATNNLGGAISETILGGNIVLEGIPAGMWLALAIIADSATVDFDDPSTWLAWDAAPFLVRKPWQGLSNDTCI